MMECGQPHSIIESHAASSVQYRGARDSSLTRLTPDKLVLVIGVETSVDPHPAFHFATQD